MIFNSNQSNKEILEKIKAGEKNFKGLNLSGMSFKNMDLSKCDFTDSDLTKTVFRKAKLDNAIFKNAVLLNASLVKVSAKKSNFTGAILQKADMLSGDFTESDFTDANLEKAILDGALFTKAVMRKAKLNKTILNDVNFVQADLKGTSFLNCDGMDSDFTEASFCEADLTASVLVYANFTKADFSRSILNKGEFNFSNFTEASFVDTKVKEANMKKIYGVNEQQENIFQENGALVSGHYIKKLFEFLWKNKIARVIVFLLVILSIFAFYKYFSNPLNRGSAYLMVKADKYESLGTPENAISLLEIVASRKDVYNKFAANLNLSDIYYRQGKKEKAIATVSEALRISEDNLLEISLVLDAEKKMISFLRGAYGIEKVLDYIKMRKEFYKSEEYFVKALSLQEANIHFSLGNYDQANKLYASLAETAEEVVYNNDLGFSIVFFKQAVIAFEKGDKEKVHQCLMQYMDFLAKYSTSDLLYANESEKIIFFIIKFYLDNPSFKTEIINIPQIFKILIFNSSDLDTANDVQFRFFLFLINQNQNDYLKKILDELDIDYENNKEFYYFKAVLTQHLGDLKEADEYFQKALTAERQRNILAILLSYVEFLSSNMEYDKAVSVLQDFLYIDDHYVDIVMHIISFLKQQKKYDEALEWLEKIKKYSYYRSGYYLELSRINLIQLKKEKAYENFFKALNSEKDKINVVNLWNEFFNEPYFVSKIDDKFFVEQLEKYQDNPAIVFLFLRNLLIHFLQKIDSVKIEDYINKYSQPYRESNPYNYYVLQGELKRFEKNYSKAHSLYKKAFEHLSKEDIIGWFYNDFNYFLEISRKENLLEESFVYLEAIMQDIQYADDPGFVSNIKYMLFGLYLEAGKIEEAEQILKSIEGVDDVGFLYQKIAQYYLGIKKIDKALIYYSKQLDVLSSTFFFTALGNIINSFENLSSEKELEKFLLDVKARYSEKNPMLKNDINLMLAKYYVRNKKVKEASLLVEEISPEMLNPPKAVYFLIIKSDILAMGKDKSLSEKAYSEILFNNNCTPDYFFNIYNKLMDSYAPDDKKYEKRMQVTDKLIEFHAGKPMFIFTLLDRKVLYLKELSRYQESEEIYKKLIAEGERYLDKFRLYLRYAELFVVQERYTEALNIYNEAQEFVSSENAGELLFSASNIFAKTKDYENWEVFVDKIAEKYGYDDVIATTVTLTRAKIYFTNGNCVKAYDYIMSVLEKNRITYDFLDFYIEVFEVLLGNNEIEKAEKLAVKILQPFDSVGFGQCLWIFDSVVQTYTKYITDTSFLNETMLKILNDNISNSAIKQAACFSLIKINSSANFEEVKKYFDILEKENLSPDTADEFSFLKAQALEKQGKVEKAIELYKTIIDSSAAEHQRTRAFEFVANIYKSKNMENELLAFMEQYREDTSSEDISLLGKQIFIADVETYMQKGDTKKAKEAILHFLDTHQNEDNFNLYFELAAVNTKEKQYDRALDIYKELLQKTAYSGQSAAIIAGMLDVVTRKALSHSEDPYPNIKQFADETMAKYADNSSVIQACVSALASLNINRNPQEALKYITDLEDIYINQQQEVPLNLLCDKISVFMNMGDTEKAFALLSKMANVPFDKFMFADAAQRIIAALQEKGKNRQVSTFINDNIVKYADNPYLSFFFRNALITHYRYSGDLVKTYQAKLKIRDDYPDYFNNSKRSIFDYQYDLANIAMEIGEYEQAYANYKDCLNSIDVVTDKNTIRETFLNFVKVGIMIGQEDEIKDFISKIEKQPLNNVIVLSLSQARALLEKQNGNFSLALKYYLEAYKVNQGDTLFSILFEIEQLSKQLGDYQDVLNIYKELLRDYQKLNKAMLIFAVRNFVNISQFAGSAKEADAIVLNILENKKNDFSILQELVLAAANGKMERLSSQDVAEFVTSIIDTETLGDKGSKDLYSMLANLFMADNQYQKARSYYLQILKKVTDVSSIDERNNLISSAVFEIFKTLRFEGDLENLEKYSVDFIKQYPDIPALEFFYLIEKANLLLNVGKQQEALIVLTEQAEQKISSSNDEQIFYFLLMDVYAGLNSYEKILEIAAKAVTVNKENPDSVIAVFNRLFSLSPSESYIALLDSFIADMLKPFENDKRIVFEVKVQLGTFYNNFNMPNKALNIFAELSEKEFTLSPQDKIRLDFQVVSALGRKGDFPQATEKLKAFLKRVDTDKASENDAVRDSIIIDIASSYINYNKIDEGLLFIDQMISDYSKNEVVKEKLVYQKSVMLDDGGQDEEALNLFENFLKTYPKTDYKSEIFRRLAELYRAKQDYDNSVLFYKKALDLNNQDIEHNLWMVDSLFVIYFEAGKIEEALEFKKMLESKYAGHYAVMKKLRMLDGDFYIQQKLYDKAIAYYTKSLPEATDNNTRRDILEKMAVCYRFKGEETSMVEIYQKLLNDPSVQDCYKHPYITEIINFYNMQSDNQKLEIFLNEMSAKYEQDREISYLLSLSSIRLYKNKGDFKNALTVLNKLQPLYTEPWKVRDINMEFADIYKHNNNFKKAADYYKEILFLKDNTPDDIKNSYYIVGEIVFCYNSFSADTEGLLNAFFAEVTEKYSDYDDIIAVVEFEKAKLLAEKNRYQEAITKLKEVEDKAQNQALNIDILKEIAKMYLAVNDYNSASNQCENIFKKISSIPMHQWVVDEILQYYNNSAIPSEVREKFITKIYREFGDKEAFKKPILLHLARMYAQALDFQKADDYFKQIYQLQLTDNSLIYLYEEHGNIMQAAKKYEEARKYYHKSFEKSVAPAEKMNAVRNIINIYLEQGLKNELEIFIKEILNDSKVPYKAFLFYHLGLLKKEQMQSGAYQEYMEKALALKDEPFFITETYIELADIYQNQKAYRKAEASYKQYAGLNPNDSVKEDIRQRLLELYREALVYYQNENNEEEVAYFTDLLK